MEGTGYSSCIIENTTIPDLSTTTNNNIIAITEDAPIGDYNPQNVLFVDNKGKEEQPFDGCKVNSQTQNGNDIDD